MVRASMEHKSLSFSGALDMFNKVVTSALKNNELTFAELFFEDGAWVSRIEVQRDERTESKEQPRLPFPSVAPTD